MSSALELAPSQDQRSNDDMDSDSVPGVAFLDPPTLPTKSNLKSTHRPP